MIHVELVEVHVASHVVSVLLVELIEVHSENEESQTCFHFVLLKKVAELVESSSVVSGKLVQLVAGLGSYLALAPDLIAHVSYALLKLFSSLKLLCCSCVKDVLSELELMDQLENLCNLLVNLKS